MRSKIRWFTDSANHTTYRISLRSSSLREPRHPLLRVISVNTSFSSLLKRSGDKKGKLHTRKLQGVYGRVKIQTHPRRMSSYLRKTIHSVGWIIFNDPSAGSPTETLLRLLLPLNDKVQRTSHDTQTANRQRVIVRTLHRTIQSVGATGGVYKGQGRNQRKLMTCAYQAFLVED